VSIGRFGRDVTVIIFFFFFESKTATSKSMMGQGRVNLAVSIIKPSENPGSHHSIHAPFTPLGFPSTCAHTSPSRLFLKPLRCVPTCCSGLDHSSNLSQLDSSSPRNACMCTCDRPITHVLTQRPGKPVLCDKGSSNPFYPGCLSSSW
jgi:hypothetical protein